MEIKIKINAFPLVSDEAFTDAVKENVDTMANALLRRMVEADAKIQNARAEVLMLKSKVEAMQQEIIKSLEKISESNAEIDANTVDFQVAQEILMQLCPSALPESWKK